MVLDTLILVLVFTSFTSATHQCLELKWTLHCEGAKNIDDIPFYINKVIIDQSMENDGIEYLILKGVLVKVIGTQERICDKYCQSEIRRKWESNCKCVSIMQTIRVVLFVCFSYALLLNDLHFTTILYPSHTTSQRFAIIYVTSQRFTIYR